MIHVPVNRSKNRLRVNHSLSSFQNISLVSLTLLVSLSACGGSEPLEGDFLSRAFRPMDLVLAGEYVYWTHNVGGREGEIKRVRKDGSEAMTIASHQDAYEIVADEEFIYWANDGSGFVMEEGVMKYSIQNGDLTILASRQNSPSSVAVDRNSVFWDNRGLELFKVPLSGGDPTQLFVDEGHNGIANIVVDSTFVYWTHFNNGKIKKIPIDGGEPITLVSDLKTPWGLAIDDDNLYWANNGENGADDDGSIMMMGLGETEPTILASNQHRSFDIAVDETHVYWTNFHSITGTIMKIALGGGKPVTLAEFQDGPKGIAVDETHVYWVNLGEYDRGAVMRVKK